ncbi:UDP-N-acetylmuramate--L-alanine ligase [Larkinella punicea]|uniref:Peptidoglycan synthetase n=1 Tax=Larkinella punicea TaxID=2315727 RepID=A0A368JJY0_9BACT|nr:Mur ligase domain-containing protein [Larkinella punicea]RCR67960.1 peptidoglycan synthetase [Larkinella punicea]
MKPLTIHFISIGGSVMHNLAIALHQQGHQITGSDDEIHEPSHARLNQYGLLPEHIGWHPDAIHSGLDAVILGMHARADNPELQKAQELNLPVYSYPEFVYQQSQNKQRVVIAGSHGKTTITAMILHVLHYHKRNFDYLVGAQIEGFETMVKLTTDAPIIIIEGDEYGTSPIDPRPKFLHYHPHMVLISGIAWDHVNLYPTYEQYVHQFELLADAMSKSGTIVFDDTDDMLDVIALKEREDVTRQPYDVHPYRIENGKTVLVSKQHGDIPVLVFGEHNLKNISGALAICDHLAITEEMFYAAIQTFKGASKRLEKVKDDGSSLVFRDFAHAPSKVEATTAAVKAQFPDRRLVACVELHTFSSLNKTFLKQYRDKLDKADVAVIFYSPHTLEIKHLDPIDAAEIATAFDRPDLQVFTDSAALETYLKSLANDQPTVYLFMSSGTFGGLDLKTL